MKFVAVGGGHGTAVSLRALKLLSPEVTGVVSVADDGGSTGRPARHVERGGGGGHP